MADNYEYASLERFVGFLAAVIINMLTNVVSLYVMMKRLEWKQNGKLAEVAATVNTVKNQLPRLWKKEHTLRGVRSRNKAKVMRRKKASRT